MVISSNTKEITDYRIGIDTGAYDSNCLTCLVLMQWLKAAVGTDAA